MTKTIEAKPVREARAAARRMAKTTELTYQQALDKVARDAGSPHWAAFAAMHPDADMRTPSPPTTKEDARPEPEKDTVPRYLRSVVSGESGANEERIRAAKVLSNAREPLLRGSAEAGETVEVDQHSTRRNMWWSAIRNAATVPVIILVAGGASAIAGAASPDPDAARALIGFDLGDIVRASGCAAILMAALFTACLVIGDQAGMERRRSTMWTLMLWMQIAGAAPFVLGGFGAVDGLMGRITGMDPYTIIFLGAWAIIVGGPIRRSIHAVMVLGAALGPKGEASSIADPKDVEAALEAERCRAKSARASAGRPVPMTPEMARELGRKKPWWCRIGLFEVLAATVATGAALALAGAALTLWMRIDARMIGYASIILMSPMILLYLGGIALDVVHEVRSAPGRWKERLERHRMVRERERTRSA